MRRFFNKRTVSIIALTAMAVSLLGGCRNSGTKTSAVKTDDAKSEASEELLQFKSVKDVTFPLKQKLELTVFVYATATGGGTYQDNYVTDWIEQKTNIHLNYVYDLDGDDAKTKLNLVMTDSASLPDIFLATNWTKSEVQSYGQQGLILPLNDYLKDAPNWNANNEKSPGRKADLTMTDGNIYTYGDENESFHNMFQNRMWIYMPWVDKLNDGKVPQTTDELYDYMKKIKTQDPNGNGAADEIPMTGYIGGWATDPTVWMINSFVQCNNPLSNTNPTVAAGFVVNNGKIEYNVMKDQYKDALKYMNKLYKEGLLDNQTFTQDNTQFDSALNNADHLVGLYADGGVNADGDNFWAKKPGDWQNWACLEPVAGPDGVRLAARSIATYFGSSIGSISANCKYPVIAAALFDFMASEEASNVQAYGPEGFGWDWTTEGTSLGDGVPKYETHTIPDDFDWIGNGFPKNYAHKAYTADAMVRSSDIAYRSALKIENPDLDVEYVFQKAAEKYEKYSPDINTLIPNLAFEGEDSQAVSEYTLTIGGYVNQATVQFITGNLDIDKEWDNYISKLKDMGVEDYIKRYQKCYDAYMKTEAGNKN
nr:DUF3502 domain-containing protein [uncultured Clostridium sp.]